MNEHRAEVIVAELAGRGSSKVNQGIVVARSAEVTVEGEVVGTACDEGVVAQAFGKVIRFAYHLVPTDVFRTENDARAKTVLDVVHVEHQQPVVDRDNREVRIVFAGRCEISDESGRFIYLNGPHRICASV